VNQLPLATIRSKYFSEITDLGDSTEACANYLHDALEYKAPWVLSAFCLFVSKVAQDVADFSLSPLYRQLSMLPAYTKFGVNTPAAAFFSMIGVGAREVAILLAKHYHDQHPDARFNFARMLDWLLALEPEEVVQWFQAEAGRGLAGYVPRLFSFLDSIRSQEQTLDDILPVDIEVAGWRFYRGPEVLSQLIVGDEVRLKPDPLNPWDPYAVEVFDLRGAKLGFIPKSYSRAVQTHLISEQSLICRIVQIDSSLVYRPVKLRLE
jgi:hypothetical protein